MKHITHKWVCPFCTGRLDKGSATLPLRECRHPSKKGSGEVCPNNLAAYRYCRKNDLEMPWICEIGAKEMTGRRAV